MYLWHLIYCFWLLQRTHWCVKASFYLSTLAGMDSQITTWSPASINSQIPQIIIQCKSSCPFTFEWSCCILEYPPFSAHTSNKWSILKPISTNIWNYSTFWLFLQSLKCCFVIVLYVKVIGQRMCTVEGSGLHFPHPHPSRLQKKKHLNWGSYERF